MPNPNDRQTSIICEESIDIPWNSSSALSICFYDTAFSVITKSIRRKRKKKQEHTFCCGEVDHWSSKCCLDCRHFYECSFCCMLASTSSHPASLSLSNALSSPPLPPQKLVFSPECKFQWPFLVTHKTVHKLASSIARVITLAHTPSRVLYGTSLMWTKAPPFEQSPRQLYNLRKENRPNQPRLQPNSLEDCTSILAVCVCVCAALCYQIFYKDFFITSHNLIDPAVPICLSMVDK